MVLVPKRPQSASNQASRRHHRRPHPIPSQTTPPSHYHEAQKLFEAEQRQNRAWLHNQLQTPGFNDITGRQHVELVNYFSSSTLYERERPPLAKEGLKLSQASQEHLARLTKERNEQREKQGVPGKWTRVKDWWDEGPMEAKHKRNRGRENRKAKRIRAFMEKKDREMLGREANARETQVTESLGKMQIGNADGQDMVMDEGEGFLGGMTDEVVDEGAEDLEGGVAMQGIVEGEEETAPRSWFSEVHK